MEFICESRNKLIYKIEYLSHRKYFNEIYCFILSIITILFWRYNSMMGMVVLAFISALVIFLTDDIKYALPSILYIIFTINHGFEANVIPYNIIIAFVVFAVVLIIYTIKNGIHISKMKSIIGLAGLALFQIIPILWNKTIDNNSTALYFLYFGNAGYLFFYVILVSGIKKNSLEIVTVAISYLGVVISLQCIAKIIDVRADADSIFDLRYSLGWGIRNEAGIMLCFCIPFIFYLISKSKQSRFMFLHNIKVWLCILGIILTNSRGSYIFLLGELIILYPLAFILCKEKFKYCQFIVLVVCSVLVLGAIFGQELIRICNDVIKKVFSAKFDDNGRKDLWISALIIFKEEPIYTAFGSGMISEVGFLPSVSGPKYGYVVYHSTVFETLAISGLAGFWFLLVHFVDKYRSLTMVNKNFMLIVGVGFLFTDLYGMIDNTYHMFYYMIPLVILLAAIDANSYEEFYKLF